MDEPLLGLATTRQMLECLAVRFEIPTPHDSAKRVVERLLRVLTDKELDYRTVDSC